MLRVDSVPLEELRSVMNKEAVTRVVLADDHAVVRQGLRRLLNRAPDVEVVGEASDGLEALNSVKELRPDVLLLDIEMPVMDGVEVARRLRESDVRVRILILSAYDDREYIRALLDIGVSGFLIKGEAPGKIIEAVRKIAKGQNGWVSPQVRKKVEKLQKPDIKRSTFTNRELEILNLLGSNKSNQEIARHFNLSEAAIADELSFLYSKIGAKNRQEAVDISSRQGWTADPDRGF